MKELILNTDDKIQIAVNHYESFQRKSVVIICPGCFMSKDAKPFLDMSADLFRQFDIMTMDFRGHGKSSGLYTFTAQEHNDLRTVVRFAKRNYSKIAIIGFSLGAATTIIYAAKYKDIQSVIAISAPVDFDKIENRFMKKEAVMSALEKFEFGKSPNIRPGNIFQKKQKPIDVVNKIHPIPILLISGSKDPIVFPWHTEELYKKACEPKAIVEFQEGLHAENLYLNSKDKFLKVCNDWLVKTMKG
jgi:alpha-beta hydrolase superfamily lysophospholipase